MNIQEIDRGEQHAPALWLGTIEVRSGDAANPILEGAKGAFVKVVTWACTASAFQAKAELIMNKVGGLSVTEVLEAAPLEGGWANERLGEEAEDMVARARDNPKAIIYGTFHLFDHDDA